MVYTVAKGPEVFSGMYLEWASERRHKTSFQKMKKTMFFCKTSNAYLFVNIEKSKNLQNLSYFSCGTF